MKNLIRHTLFALVLSCAFLFAASFVCPQVANVETAQAATTKISKTSVTLVKGQTQKLKVKGTSAKVTWSSSNKSVATVDSNGKVTAKKKGTATITAKVNGKKYTCKVKVKKALYVKTTNITVNVGESVTIDVYWNGKGYASYGTDTDIITGEFGDWSKYVMPMTFTGVSAGTTTIVFRCSTSGEEYTVSVTVKDPAAADEAEEEPAAEDTGDSGDSVASNYATLKAYIKTYGSTNTSGNKFIKSTWTNYGTATIIYHESQDRLEFVYTCSSSSTDCGFDMYLDTTASDATTATVIVLNSSASAGFQSTGTFLASTYTSNTTVTFTQESLVKYTSTKMQTLSNSVMKTAMAAFNLLLYENTGMKLGDLGFTSYN